MSLQGIFLPYLTNMVAVIIESIKIEIAYILYDPKKKKNETIVVKIEITVWD